MYRLFFLCFVTILPSLSGCVAEKPATNDRQAAGDDPSGINSAGMRADSGGDVVGAVLIDDAETTEGGTNATGDDAETQEEEDRQPTGDECIEDDDCPLAMVQSCVDGRCLDRCGMGIGCLRGGECIDGVCIKECDESDDCGAGERCDENKCVTPTPCTTPDECTRDERCNTQEGVCEPLERCVGDRTCAEDEVCAEGRCRVSAECNQSSDCDDDLECIGGRCVPRICRGDEDCAEGERCRAGDCIVPEAPAVSSVRILTAPRTIRVGQRMSFQAIALNEAGEIVSTDGFRWSSTDGDIVTIDEDTGEATGGPETGTSNIAATYINPDQSAVTSDPVVPVRVITAEIAPTFQVRAIARDTGEAASRVSIVVGDETIVTNADGIARFDVADGPVTVTAFSNTYNTLTVVGAPATEVILPLERRRPMGDIAGFTGEVDFSDVRTEGGVELSLTGASFGEGLDRLSFSRLIGDIFSRNIGLGNFSFDLPLPGGVTLRAELPFIGDSPLKTKIYAVAEPGLRLGWTFGGRLDANELFRLFQMGGDIDVGEVLAQLFPYFETFEHGLFVADDLPAFPRVPDEDDNDKDEDRDELVPDYEQFPEFTVRPNQPQQLRMSIDTQNTFSQGETALYFAGMELEGVGFVPLGVTAASEENEIVPSRLASPYGGLEGGRPVMVNLTAQFGGEQQIPADIVLRVQRYAQRVPADVTWPENTADLQPPMTPDFDEDTRELSGTSIDSASFHRALIQTPEGTWTILFAPGAANTLTLPVPPEGVADLSQDAFDVFHEAFILNEDADFQALLVQDGAFNLGDIERLFTAMSRAAR